MSLKFVGVMLVIGGCGGFGFLIAASYRHNTRLLQQLMRVLNVMECELQYRMSPLPELCKASADVCTGALRHVFLRLAEKLNTHTASCVSQCMLETVSEASTIPKSVARFLLILGDSLGRFGLEGQLKGIAFVRTSCEDMLNRSMANQEIRLRSYQTLGICAGAALAILLI